jgi:peptidoglycan/LPS O-acetylase OafA/YrhL
MSRDTLQPTPPGIVSSDRAKSPERFEWLDALRGVAILAIFFVHSGYPFPSLGDLMYPLFLAGRYGVDLFFVISGFALYHAYRRLEQRSGTPRRTFLFRRWARLAPVYYIGIVVYGVLGQLASHQPTASWSSVVSNLLFLNGWIPHHANSTVPGGWSISAEAAFAILFVCILPWLRTFRSALVVSVVSWLVTRVSAVYVEALLTGEGNVASLPGMDSEYIPWQHLPTFIFGVCCWHGWNSRRSPDSRVGTIRLIVYTIAGVGSILALAFKWQGAQDRTLLAGGGFAFLVLACAERGLPKWACRLLSGLGRISFGLYLFHFAFLNLARTAVATLLPIGSPALLIVVVTMLMTLVGTAPLAFVSWKYIERPVQDWAAKVKFGSEVTSNPPQ